MFKYIVVGAGFAGAVMAERIANERNEQVLIIERRQHIAGNAYDQYNSHGILVHRYGPHIFHTNMKEVWEYLSQFTEWHPYQHEVLGYIDGMQVPIAINLNSLSQLLPHSVAKGIEQKLIQTFGYESKVPILRLRETEDEQLKWLAELIYNKVFLNYTIKQWGVQPEELNPQVTGRVPVKLSRDNRYFQDRYQGIPKHGYTRMFERMLSNPNIRLMLNTSYQEVVELDPITKRIRLFGQPFDGQLIYTGKIDELFDYSLGELPYRSLHFESSTLNQPNYQQVGTVNYPNDYAFTRITEFKHLTGQQHAATTIVREYPQEYDRHVPGKDIPYYPFPNDVNHALYAQYRTLAKSYRQLTLLGRLAEYTYYDMDAVVAKALKVYLERIHE